MKINSIATIRARVDDINILSGDLAYGFPAMTALVGYQEAVSRIVNNEKMKIAGFTVCSHFIEPFIQQRSLKYPNSLLKEGHKGPFSTYAQQPVLLRSSFGARSDSGITNKKNKKAEEVDEKKLIKMPSLHDYFRGSGEISFLFAIEKVADVISVEEAKHFYQLLKETVEKLRFAGGQVNTRFGVKETFDFINLETVSEQDVKRFFKKLMPGFFPIDRSDILQTQYDSMEAGSTMIDAMLTICSIPSILKTKEEEKAEKDKSEELDDFIPEKQTTVYKSGWYVPSAIGFSPVSDVFPAGESLNARDKTKPLVLAESCYSIVEFSSASKFGIKNMQDIFWGPCMEEGRYMCRNIFAKKATKTNADTAKNTFNPNF